MNRKIGAIAAASVIALSGAAIVGNQLADPPMVGTKACEDWNIYLTDGECFAAGQIRFLSLQNQTAAGQFCKWQAANPGEWSRLKGYANTGTEPTGIVTWMGAGLKNQIGAYFVTGAPTWPLAEYRPPNRCKTPLPPPGIQEVIPEQDKVTVKIKED